MALVVLAGCGGTDPAADVSGPSGLEDASARVRRIVDDTASTALPDGSWRVDSLSRENDGLTPCMDEAGGFTDEVTRHYGVETSLPEGEDPRRVVEAARDFWEREAFGAVDAAELGQEGRSEYAIFLTGEGYNFEFFVDTASGVATVGGSTPCLPPPDGG